MFQPAAIFGSAIVVHWFPIVWSIVICLFGFTLSSSAQSQGLRTFTVGGEFGEHLPVSSAAILSTCGNDVFSQSSLENGNLITASSGSNSRSEGVKRLLYMRVSFLDDAVEPISFESATSVVTQMEQVFAEFSYNKISFTSVVTPLLSLPRNKAAYGQLAPIILLNEARAAALQAGFNTADYDFDVVRFRNVPGWTFAGLALTGGKGVWLQSSSVSAIVHEVGHNLGLEHANLWVVGDDSVIGPSGSNQAYGNIFDTMALENSKPASLHFNAVWKNRLNWLPVSAVQSVSNSALCRLEALESVNLESNRAYALKIGKDLTRSYWVEFRRKVPSNPWAESGVLLNWNPWSGSSSGTQLLDTTPGTPSGNSGRDDSPVTVGRTFSDYTAGAYITPLNVGQNASNRWIDVQVNIGAFPGNTPPVLNITASATEVSVSDVVLFSAVATDPEGDLISYHWDFGDLSFGSNASVVAKSWPQSGEYLVRCVASDMKGGISSRHSVIRVGSPATFHITGQVLDTVGSPVQGVRIYNGLSGSAYRGAYTDVEGLYVLPNVAAGSHSISALKYGYSLSRDGWNNPIAVGPDATSINFVAVSTATNPPAITGQPQSQLVTVSSNATFSATATGTPPPTYRWYFNVTNLIPGATNSSFTVSNVQDADGGFYSVVVSNGVSVTSSNALLTVNHPPAATAPLLERFAFNGTKARFADFLGGDPDGDRVTLFSVGPGTAQGGTVTTNSGWVIYTPPPGFTNVDSFPFAVSDGRGGISLGTANVAVTFDNVVPQNFRAEILGNGSVRLIFDGIQSRTYSIEYAENLESPAWQKLATVTADEHGVFVYTDLLPNDAPQRFYRATWP